MMRESTAHVARVVAIGVDVKRWGVPLIKKTHLQDPTFQQPQDSCVSVWRYLDLPRFVSMLQNNPQVFYAECRSEMPPKANTRSRHSA